MLTTPRQTPAADGTVARAPNSIIVPAGTYTVNGLDCPTEVITVTNGAELKANISNNLGDYTYILESGEYVIPGLPQRIEFPLGRYHAQLSC